MFSGFSHFSISELLLSTGQSPRLTPFSFCFLSVTYLVLFIIFVSIYFFSPSSYFFISGLYFLSLILLFPSRCPLTKHPLPTPYLKQRKKRAPLAWNRKDRIEQKGGRLNLGRACLVMLITSLSSVGPLQSPPQSACVPSQGTRQTQGEALGTATAEAVFKFSQVSIRLRNYKTGLYLKHTVTQISFPTSQNPYPLESKTKGKGNQNVST